MVGEARNCCKHSLEETGDGTFCAGTWELVVSVEVVCRRFSKRWDFLLFLIFELRSCLRLFMAWRTLLADEFLRFDLCGRLDMLKECGIIIYGYGFNGTKVVIG